MPARVTASCSTRIGPRASSSIWWLVYLGVFPTALAFTTWAYALSHMNASSLGATTYLVPPITVLLGWLFLGEVPPALAFVGGALCLGGVALTRSSVEGPQRSSSFCPGASTSTERQMPRFHPSEEIVA